MIRTDALKKNEPLFWTPAMVADLREMFGAAIAGDVEAITRLLDKDPSLARGHYEYRTALSFAVRENQVDVAAVLLERGADPINSGMPDTLLQVARDRGYDGMERLLQRA